MSSELKGLEAPTKSPPRLLHMEFAPAITAKLFEDEAVFPIREFPETSSRPPLVITNDASSKFVARARNAPDGIQAGALTSVPLYAAPVAVALLVATVPLVLSNR